MEAAYNVSVSQHLGKELRRHEDDNDYEAISPWCIWVSDELNHVPNIETVEHSRPLAEECMDEAVENIRQETH